ncbi:hypothetical protein D9758_018697 [Tetrapyrgos nigripes]|uniref:Uncharacterized protein n=1 Tax=Tetrapyrgos nigripes TaxID=182062 RepID=A0A8H5BVB3_9AGAR|nr:hypothetical protein D9758_018697 [Tetrapyrgos nigripes]
MFPASFILSCFLIAMLSQPTVTFWTKISFHLALSFWSISIAFNVIVTFLIAARLLLMRQRSSKLLGYHSSSPYTTVSAMLIESAFIYSSTGLAFLISYGVNSPVQNLFLPLLGQVQSIAPLLIILRVAEGKGWSKDTANAITHTSSLHCASRGTVPAHITSETVLNTMGSRDRMTDNRGPEEQSIFSEFVGASCEQVAKKV